MDRSEADITRMLAGLENGEAWMRVMEGQAPDWNGRGHFFGAAAQAMRRILVERARRKARLKHGGGAEHVALDDLEPEDDVSTCSARTFAAHE